MAKHKPLRPSKDFKITLSDGADKPTNPEEAAERELRIERALAQLRMTPEFRYVGVWRRVPLRTYNPS